VISLSEGRQDPPALRATHSDFCRVIDATFFCGLGSPAKKKANGGKPAPELRSVLRDLVTLQSELLRRSNLSIINKNPEHHLLIILDLLLYP
jgi:hypothetical protein